MTTFKHSGNIGDIVYSIPAMKAMCSNPTLYIQPNVRGEYYQGAKHPCGPWRISDSMLNFALPLFQSQFKTERYINQPFDVNLDDFRKGKIDYSRGNICRWYFWTFHVNADLSKPWLTVEPDESYSDTIIVNRTSRYRNPQIHYEFLRNYKKVVFLGLKEEANDFVNSCPHAVAIEASNALEAARKVAGCRLFIGNQSFLSAVAEALKVPRVLEVCSFAWNCQPQGPKGWDAISQPGFMAAVEEAMK